MNRMDRSYAVKLRTKIVTSLELEKNITLRDNLRNIIANFRLERFGDASKVIFNLIYGNEEVKESTLRQYGFTHCEDMATRYIYLKSDDHVTLLGNEFCYQYRMSHPDFLKISDDPRYQKELNALKKAMIGHPLLLFKSVEMCKSTHNIDEQVSTCVNQLISKNVDSQQYGLRKLGFNAQWQHLLQPYATEIGQLLLAMHSAYEKEQQSLANQEKSKFADQKDKIILDHPNLDTYWECLKNLRTAGFDINLLSSDEVYVRSILNAHNTLKKAVATLNDAEQAYKMAYSEFSMGNYQSLYNLFQAGNAFEEAKVAYTAAFESFLKCCQDYEKAAMTEN